MDITLEAIAAELAKQLEGVEGRLTEHVSKQLGAGIGELKHQAELHRESLKQDVIAAAEGYGANLERIERALTELNNKVDQRFGDHDLILAEHNTRTTRVEQR